MKIDGNFQVAYYRYYVKESAWEDELYFDHIHAQLLWEKRNNYKATYKRIVKKKLDFGNRNTRLNSDFRTIQYIVSSQLFNFCICKMSLFYNP